MMATSMLGRLLLTTTNLPDKATITKSDAIQVFQYPRGVNRGVLDTEICPTISCSSWENNCFFDRDR